MSYYFTKIVNASFKEIAAEISKKLKTVIDAV